MQSVFLEKYFQNIARAIRSELKLKQHYDLSILLTDDKHIRKLNRQFRGFDKPTNVLSFPSGEKNYLGDIAISYDTIVREAKEQKKSVQDHMTHMVVHGILHLLGYDHEQDKEAGKMEALEVKILAKLGVSNPYL